jgi:hypothetical protein
MSVKQSTGKYVDRVTKVAGRLMLTFTPADVGTVSRATWFLNPIQFGTTKVLDDLAHQFIWFRFTKLRVLLGESGAESGDIQAVQYLPYPPVSLPADLESIVESGESCVLYTSDSVLSEMTLTRKTLLSNQPKWFRVEPIGDDYLEYQGVLVWGATSQTVGTSYLFLEYEIELLGLADDPLTPAPYKRPGMAHDPPLLKVGPSHWKRQYRPRRLERPPPLVLADLPESKVAEAVKAQETPNSAGSNFVRVQAPVPHSLARPLRK